MTTGFGFFVGSIWCRFCGDMVGSKKQDYAESRCALCSYVLATHAKEHHDKTCECGT